MRAAEAHDDDVDQFAQDDRVRSIEMSQAQAGLFGSAFQLCPRVSLCLVFGKQRAPEPAVTANEFRGCEGLGSNAGGMEVGEKIGGNGQCQEAISASMSFEGWSV